MVGTALAGAVLYPDLWKNFGPPLPGRGMGDR